MARSGLTSALLSGFLAVFYFALLERATGGLARWASVFAKVAVDVGIYEPIYDTLYITLQALLRGEDLHAAKKEVQEKVLKVWRMAPRYWCFADTINFAFVDLRLRPLINALLSIPWSMYISFMANSGVQGAGDAVEEEAAAAAAAQHKHKGRRKVNAVQAHAQGGVGADGARPAMMARAP